LLERGKIHAQPSSKGELRSGWLRGWVAGWEGDARIIFIAPPPFIIARVSHTLLKQLVKNYFALCAHTQTLFSASTRQVDLHLSTPDRAQGCFEFCIVVFILTRVAGKYFQKILCTARIQLGMHSSKRA
jgi:hypothetical protein